MAMLFKPAFLSGSPISAKEQQWPRPRKSGQIWGCQHCTTVALPVAEQLNREFKMSFKKASVAAVLAVSMASTPVLAQSSAAPLSVAARSDATTAGASEPRGGFIIPAIAIIAIILGILALTGGHGDRPHSP